MKTREDTIGEWLMSKILSYLKSKESFTMPFGIDDKDMTKVIVEDNLGFRYEITVKNIGRSPDRVRNNDQTYLETRKEHVSKQW